jgi:aryl-alcohol dehydrogenase-like predicted oxidoreductase
MRYREHGGERLSEIGIGCYALSGVYGRKDPEQFVGLVRRAAELGVTFFDTADVYGPGEEILGRAVAPFRRRVWVATKVGANPSGKADCSAAHVLASCEQSLLRLQTDYVDLYQIHFDDPETPVEETVEALKQLKAAGKIRHYGVGHLSRPKLEAYLTHGDPFSVLTELSGAARGARERVLPLCQDRGMAAIAFSVTGRGLLTGKIGPDHAFEEGDIRRIDPLFQRECFASGMRVAERFLLIGERHGKTPVQVAIAWVLAQPAILCALTGPSTLPHLEENLDASGWAIPPEEMAQLDRFFEAEDEWLHQEQMKSIQTVLAKKLEPETAFTDLVYVLETLAEMELAEEEMILPFFHRLLAQRGQKDANALDEMQAIQGDLRAGFSSAIGPTGAHSRNA